jgi:hypothetical protein
VNHVDIKTDWPTNTPTAMVVRAMSHLRNGGKTPALNFHIGQWLRVFNGTIPDTLEYPAFDDKSSFAPLAPNAISTVVNTDDITPEAMQAFRRQEKTLCLYGRARYRDLAGTAYETTWCLSFEPRLNTFGYAGKHNNIT